MNFILLGAQTVAETKKRFLFSRLQTISLNSSGEPSLLDKSKTFIFILLIEIERPNSSRILDENKPILYQHANSVDSKTQLAEGSLKKEKSNSLFGRKKEPKIIITPAKEEKDAKNVATPDINQPENRSLNEITSPTLPPLSRKKSHLGGIFRKKTDVNQTKNTAALIRHRQSLTRSASIKIFKAETGRLLSIIANQALFGKNADISKIFHEALVYSP